MGGLWGCTVLGDFSERFVAPIGVWNRTDYERQWLHGAKRLVGGAMVSGVCSRSGAALCGRHGLLASMSTVQQLLLFDPLMRLRGPLAQTGYHTPYRPRREFEVVFTLTYRAFWRHCAGLRRRSQRRDPLHPRFRRGPKSAPRRPHQ